MKWALSCAELGDLLGVSADSVRKYENGDRRIPTEKLIACELIFGVSASRLFPALYEATEQSVLNHSYDLRARAAKSTDAKAERKLTLIDSVQDRLLKNSPCV